MRHICQIKWSGGGAPSTVLRIRLASTHEVDALEEMERLNHLAEPHPSTSLRLKTMLLVEASDVEWADASPLEDFTTTPASVSGASAATFERRGMSDQTTVLLASDFTARSDRPLDRATLLAREMNARLAIAHVLEDKDAKTDGDAIEASLRADLPDEAANADLIVRAGSAPTTLSDIAAESGAALIVCGVARFNSIGDFLLGTAVDHIVRHADVPVLVVRKRVVAPYRHLLVATDFSESSRAALLAAAALFPQTAITLAHAFHVPFEGWLKSQSNHEQFAATEQNELEQFLADPSISADLRARITPRNEEGELSNVIHHLLRETGADLLVLGAHGRSGIAHAALGSNAADLLASVKSDVLMVRARKDGQK